MAKNRLKMQANTRYGVPGTVSVISFFNFNQEDELPLTFARKSQKKSKNLNLAPRAAWSSKLN